jgi:hypothetical protein
MGAMASLMNGNNCQHPVKMLLKNKNKINTSSSTSGRKHVSLDNTLGIKRIVKAEETDTR